MSTNDTQQTSTPDANFCGVLRTTGGHWTGKRILVEWTNRALKEGSDWPAFRVIAETDDGFFCQGVNSPCGAKHDGSNAFIPFKDMVTWTEWVEEAAPAAPSDKLKTYVTYALECQTERMGKRIEELERQRDECERQFQAKVAEVITVMNERDEARRERDARRDCPEYSYASTQQTECAGCGKLKHTPLRRDEMGGYVCLTCIDKRLDEIDALASVKECPHETR